MKLKQNLRRIEFLVFAFILFSFVFLLSDGFEFVPIAPTPYFIDCINGDDTNNYGSNPTNDAWKTFEPAMSLGSDCIIYVSSGTYQLTSLFPTIQPANSGSSGQEIIFVGDTTGIYWPNNPGVVEIVGYSGNPAIEIDQDYIIFENFKIDCDGDNDNGIEISSCNNITFENCKIYSDLNSIYSVSCDDLTIDNCECYKTSNTASDIIYFHTGNDLIIQDCITDLDGATSCVNNLYINTCDTATISRNQFKGTGDYGIKVYNSNDLNFQNNAIYGEFSSFGIYEYDDNVAGKWNFNTINNDGTGGGYFAERNNGNELDSFLNNIIYIDSSSHAIYIAGTPSYWKPSDASCLDYNCYYNDYSNTFGYWNGDIDTINAWQTATSAETNTIISDPDLYNDEYLLSSNSPTDCKFNGVAVAGINDDIDKGARASTNISRGADQYNHVTYSQLAMNFGPVSGPADLTLTITNYGLTNFEISGVTDSGTNPGDFSYNWNATVYPNPGVGYDLVVTFTPQGTGLKTAILEITHNAVAPGGTPTTDYISLSGIGP